MNKNRTKPGSKSATPSFGGRVYQWLSQRPYSVIIYGALLYTLTVKFFQAQRMSLIGEYFTWILSDVAVLGIIEIIMAIVCFRWQRRRVIRTVTIIAAIPYAWSVINTAWIIRTGTQILPRVLLPLFRDPLNSGSIIGINLLKMPIAAVLILGPSAVAITFFIAVLVKSPRPKYNRKIFFTRIAICSTIILTAIITRLVIVNADPAKMVSAGLRSNAQLRAIVSLVTFNLGPKRKFDFAKATRKIPASDEISIELSSPAANPPYNFVLVVLEGVQYRHTSLSDPRSKLTPYLELLAKQGVEFSNTRSTLTHTTKALFSLLTGRFPSASQDLAEAVPARKTYATIATILKDKLGFRTAFFQSAKGNFESRPSLVSNLGFETFIARDDLDDPNSHVGYLGCDEFALLKPVTDWIKTNQTPFFITILCSVTHDPYEVPQWFAEPMKVPIQRYRQTITYTDKFIAALDVELNKLHVADRTVFCVVGDHGEAFGEHGLLGHERIVFDEALRVPWLLRAPFLVAGGTKVQKPVSSVDLAPTILNLLGFDTARAKFDGLNVLADFPADRKVYFSGWMWEGPAGFVTGSRKVIYDPHTDSVFAFDLQQDPFELLHVEIDEEQVHNITEDIISWRRNTIFRLDQKKTGRKILFDRWLCRWNNRISSAKYSPKTENK